MTKHIHAELMMEYAKDAMESDTPWVNWESRCGTDYWHQCDLHPFWKRDREYRRKPKTIRIGEFDVPEPMRVVSSKQGGYWLVHTALGKVIFHVWDGTEKEYLWLNHGYCQSTQEGAELMLKALLSLTQQQAK